MIDPKQYIESGAIESCLLGIATEQEQQQLAQLAAQYPEIRQEIERVAQTLELFAQRHSVEPPPGLKERIWQRLSRQPSDRSSAAPAEHLQALNRRTRWIAAAAVIAMLCFSLSAFELYRTSRQMDTLRTELAQLRQQVDNERSAAQWVRSCLNQTQQTLASVLAASSLVTELRGTEKLPGARALVYWNQRDRRVYWQSVELPALPPTQQYQLWAIANGKPRDAGLIPQDTLLTLVPLKDAPLATQAFAVTIEPRGGSPTPTLSQMVLLGTLSTTRMTERGTR